MALATLSTSCGLAQPESLAPIKHLLAKASATSNAISSIAALGQQDSDRTLDAASRRVSCDLHRDSFGMAAPVNIGAFVAASNFENGIHAFEGASTHAISDFERFSFRDPADLDKDIEFSQLLQQSVPAPRNEAPLLPGVDILHGEDPFVVLLMQDLSGDPDAILALPRQGGLEAQGQPLQDDEDPIDALFADPDAEWARRRGPFSLRGGWARSWHRRDSISSASTATNSSLISESDDESYDGTFL